MCTGSSSVHQDDPSFSAMASDPTMMIVEHLLQRLATLMRTESLQEQFDHTVAVFLTEDRASQPFS